MGNLKLRHPVGADADAAILALQDDFLEALIKDPGITYNDKKFLKQLLTESKERQQNLKNRKKKY